MTLLFTLPRRLLSILSLSLICALPVAYAAELEGTVVPLEDTAVSLEGDATVSTTAPLDSTQTEAIPAEAAPVAPDQSAPLPNESAPPAPDAQPGQKHNNWERDWEKNLNQAFGGNHHNSDDNDDGPSGMQALIVLISLIAVIIVLCSPLILLGVYLLLRHKAKTRHQQALNTNIDKLLAAGRDIPVELLRGDEPKSADDTGNQAKGIRNICLGAGWLVFLTIAWDIEVGAIGFIWIGLGLSQVLIWYLNKPAVSEQAGQQD